MNHHWADQQVSQRLADLSREARGNQMLRRAGLPPRPPRIMAARMLVTGVGGALAGIATQGVTVLAHAALTTRARLAGILTLILLLTALGTGSALGTAAPRRLAAAAPGGITIGTGSCVRAGACTGAVGPIGANSCIGHMACYNAVGSIGARRRHASRATGLLRNVNPAPR
jgi:hypothetical protein